MIIHVSKDFINYGNNLYKQKPCKVILSTPPKKYIIQNNQTKKYEKKNEYHFVYQGGLFDPSWKNKIQFSYRNYYNIFESILQEGYHVHLYTSVNENRLPSYMKLKNDYIKFLTICYCTSIHKISETVKNHVANIISTNMFD